jgi:MFS transporter, ACS family, glucarate transporter
MIPLFLTKGLTTLTICLAGAFFFAEMTIGPMWAIPMDIAPRHSGSASGIMNTGSALAAILSPVIFGFIIDHTHNWSLPFLGSMGLFLAGSVVAFWMKPDEAFSFTSGPANRLSTTTSPEIVPEASPEIKNPLPPKPVR